MVQVLDCTFKDSGYYVDWDFEPKLVSKYLSATNSANIDIIEVGFRFTQSRSLLGVWLRIDPFIGTLNLGPNSQIAVMINASDILTYNKGIKAALNLLFNDAGESSVDIVRIAAHHKDVKSCDEIASILNGMGYRVFLNIMQVDGLASKLLSEYGKVVQNWGVVEALYFADSFGSMDVSSVESTINALRSSWQGPIGFHAHENKGNALNNCIRAIELGVEYIDGTMSGMGRGAGNARTEDLLVELSLRELELKLDEVVSLVMEDFRPLKVSMVGVPMCLPPVRFLWDSSNICARVID